MKTATTTNIFCENGLTVIVEGTWYEISCFNGVVESGSCERNMPASEVYKQYIKKLECVSSKSNIGDIVAGSDEHPYIVTDIYEDKDPYLWYKKHFKAKCLVDGIETGGALTDTEDCKNECCDINGVISGRVQSKYA